ncbi:MAG: DUF4296 domain-containing protein [Bacteroidales bacterium]|nr:DUF4296 domain-containing protein [Bacteroidales bacterium]
MKRWFWYMSLMFGVSLLAACRPRPDYVIDEDQMTELLTDVHMAEGLIELQQRQNADDPEYGQGVIAAVLDKHHISKAQYDTSLVWYSQNLNQLIRIYNHVNENLAKRKEMWEEQTQQTGGFGQNLSGADVDLWNMSRYLLLDEKRLTHRLVLRLGTDTTFWAGDTLKWRLHVPQQQGQGIVASMSLVGHDLNATTGWRVLQGATTPLLQKDTLVTLTCVADSIERLEQVVVAVHQFPAGGATERMPVVIDSLELRRIHKAVVAKK